MRVYQFRHVGTELLPALRRSVCNRGRIVRHGGGGVKGRCGFFWVYCLKSPPAQDDARVPGLRWGSRSPPATPVCPAGQTFRVPPAQRAGAGLVGAKMKKGRLVSQSTFLNFWCPRRDSNPHTLRHMDLNHARLPIPPRGPCTLLLISCNVCDEQNNTVYK